MNNQIYNNNNQLTTRDSYSVSLQISKLDNIPAGNFDLKGQYFLVKNITDNNIIVEIKLPSNNKYIKTVLYPGWNVEIIEAIKNVTINQLQYGY